MVDKDYKKLTLNRQCELLGINKSSLYYKPKGESEANLELMKVIDKLHTKLPYYGSRRIQKELKRQGTSCNLKRIRRLMYVMGIITQYPKQNLSKIAPGHKKYPYLLRGLPITKSNQVWSTDITYIPMEHGFMYLIAIIDWYSRYVLSWKLSNTMTVEFCKACLQEAIDNFSTPELFNTDQGSQFTSEKFISIWKENEAEHVKISMDGRGRATDNAFVERLWRSVKQEKIYLNSYSNGTELYMDLTEYFNFYNNDRIHQSLDYKTPSEVYFTRTNETSKKECLTQYNIEYEKSI